MSRSRSLAYNPATSAMRHLFAAHATADDTGVPVADVLAAQQERAAPDGGRQPSAAGRPGRRRVLIGAGVGAAAASGLLGSSAVAAAAAPSPSAAAGAAGTGPRIAIVGAGLAGLRTAHRLWADKRLHATVYDANPDRIGGRCWSLRGYFSGGLVAEHGGAFIDTSHTAIRRLVSRLGLHLETVNGGDLSTGKEIFRFDGKPYTYEQANADWHDIGYAVFARAAAAAPFPQRYNNHTAEGARLDRLSVPQWLDETGIGSSSRFGRLMLADVVSEYGGDPADTSALNLLYLLADNPRSSLNLIAGSDEKFHVKGGGDQIVTAMAGQLPGGSIKNGHELLALRRNSDNSYTLTFSVGAATTDVTADHVVLALPFSTLKNVDLTRSGLSPLKLRTIRSSRIGANAKIHLELAKKTWPALGYSGAAYTDYTGFCTAWDGSTADGPNGAPALLIAFPGGTVGAHTLTGHAHGPAPDRDVAWFLNQIEPIYPGTTAAFTGRAYEDHWSADPWARGAYSYSGLGQATTTGGYEGVQEGRIHFAGEHTETDSGFLNSAVVSGERVSREITAQI